MGTGIFAFYAAHMPNTLNTIKSYSATFQMPFVTSGMAVNSSRLRPYELYIRPQYSRALRDIIVEYGWTEIWYMYSNNDGLPTQLLLSLFTHIYWILNSTLCLKKVPTFKLSVTLSNLSRFSKFCTAGKRMKFATNPIRHYRHHLRHISTLRWEIKNSIFCRYSADKAEHANKLHFYRL